MGDGDGDNVSNLVEYALGSNPCNEDSDGDGMPDDWTSYCLDPGGVGIPEQPCSADTPTHIIRNGIERTNPNIDHGGRFVNPYDPSDPGGFQQWPANIIIQ